MSHKSNEIRDVILDSINEGVFAVNQRAQQLFTQNNVKVLCGAPQAQPLDLVKQYLQGKLVFGENICDH